MNDTADKQEAKGFEGFDNSTDPTKLPPGMCSDGLNVWCKGDGYVESRPGTRLNNDPADGGVLGMTYYDQPGGEYLMVWTNNNVRRVASAGNNVASTAQYAQASSVVRDARAQLLSRVFWLNDLGVIHFMDPTVGAASVGTVTQFSDGTGMPAWTHIVVQNFRLLAFDAASEKLYTSAIGQANAAADWVKTDNIRVGDGDGDPAVSLIAGQAGYVSMLCGNSCWQIDISAASVADWSSLRVTKLAGCIGQRNAIAIGQDVFFLCPHGVVSLGALANTDSISPSATLSAPIQAYIDRVNWTNVGAGFLTKWRELLLVALPLDSETQPTRIFAFHLRTRRWMAPWSFATGLRLAAAVVARFGNTQETLIAVNASPYTGTGNTILRLDDTVTYDEPVAGTTVNYESWVQLRRMDHGVNQQYKQPMFVELVFQGHTGVNTIVAINPDGVDPATTAGGMGTYQVGGAGTSNFNGTGGLLKRRWLIRNHARYREAAIQVWTTSAKLKLREATLHAFIDPPFYS